MQQVELMKHVGKAAMYVPGLFIVAQHSSRGRPNTAPLVALTSMIIEKVVLIMSCCGTEHMPMSVQVA